MLPAFSIVIIILRPSSSICGRLVTKTDTRTLRDSSYQRQCDGMTHALAGAMKVSSGLAIDLARARVCVVLVLVMALGIGLTTVAYFVLTRCFCSRWTCRSRTGWSGSIVG